MSKDENESWLNSNTTADLWLGRVSGVLSLVSVGASVATVIVGAFIPSTQQQILDAVRRIEKTLQVIDQRLARVEQRLGLIEAKLDWHEYASLINPPINKLEALWSDFVGYATSTDSDRAELAKRVEDIVLTDDRVTRLCLELLNPIVEPIGTLDKTVFAQAAEARRKLTLAAAADSSISMDNFGSEFGDLQLLREKLLGYAQKATIMLTTALLAKHGQDYAVRDDSQMRTIEQKLGDAIDRSGRDMASCDHEFFSLHVADEHRAKAHHETIELSKLEANHIGSTGTFATLHFVRWRRESNDFVSYLPWGETVYVEFIVDRPFETKPSRTSSNPSPVISADQWEQGWKQGKLLDLRGHFAFCTDGVEIPPGCILTAVEFELAAVERAEAPEEALRVVHHYLEPQIIEHEDDRIIVYRGDSKRIAAKPVSTIHLHDAHDMKLEASWSDRDVPPETLITGVRFDRSPDGILQLRLRTRTLDELYAAAREFLEAPEHRLV